MTHYLRTSNNATLVDSTAFQGDLSVTVIISEYTKQLLQLPSYKHSEFADDFQLLQELRGEWFEGLGPYPPDEKIEEFLARRLKEVAKKWDFRYVTD